MRHDKIACSMIALCILLAACGPGQLFGPRNPTATWIIFPTAGQVSPTLEPANTKAAPSFSTLFDVGPVSPVTGLPAGTDGYPWWNDSVFYEIYVRSFYDSDGDGIGDLNGIREKLDYLNDGDPDTTSDLGITGIWLMPIFPAQAVHGYSVTDFYAVNPDYGTMADLRNLIAEAHSRGMRVIIDLVLNHTGTEHPYFIDGQDPASPYHDWYIWSDTDPGYAGSWGQQVWFPLGGKYFYSSFSKNMPDLNYMNPEVTQEALRITRFWLEDVGVDGFRFDAAKHIIEEGTLQANTALTHGWWKNYRTFVKQINPDAVMVPEIWEDASITADYVQGDEHDISFVFYLAHFIVHAVEDGIRTDLSDDMELSYSLMPELQMAPFLSNHDLARVMTTLEKEPEKAKAAASIMLTAPGVPFLYYGEEIGMEGYVDGDQNRLPMQWSAGTNAGFSTAVPWKALGLEWASYNVADETSDPSSLLTHYRNLIRARSQHAALRVGDLKVLETGNEGLYGILRVSDQEAVLVLVNLTGDEITDYALSLEQGQLAGGTYSPHAIMGEGETARLSANSSGGFFEYLPVSFIPAYGTMILQLVSE